MRTSDLLRNWVSCCQQVARYKTALSRAESELEVATVELGKDIAPTDAKPGEEFCIWVDTEIIGIKGAKLIKVLFCHPSERKDYVIRWRDEAMNGDE